MIKLIIKFIEKQAGDNLRCPYCNSEDSRVLESRAAEEGKSVRRRRECIKCLRRFTTFEYVEMVPLLVIKRDGSREIFSRKKLLEGILKACEKRPVPIEEIEKLVNKIELYFQNSSEKEIPSGFIGEKVMDELKYLDEVAYIRFASIYREFKDINSFMEEAKKFLGEIKN